MGPAGGGGGFGLAQNGSHILGYWSTALFQGHLGHSPPPGEDLPELGKRNDPPSIVKS